MKWSSPRYSVSLLSWNGQDPDILSKHTDTMSGGWPFHDKTHWYYVWCFTISWQNTLLLCLGLHHFMTKHTATMSGGWPFHDKSHCYYVWFLTISWQSTLLLCLGLHHFITKHTSTMSGAWPFHDKAHCYYVWGNGQAPDIVAVCSVMKWSSPRHSSSVLCHEMVKPQT
jgi:hypothetical protein